MRTTVKWVTCFLALATLSSCASGVGTSEGSTGTAALALLLKELEPGQHYRSQDGYILEFSTFAFSFSEMSLSESLRTEEGFSADFSQEEAQDVTEIEDIAAGEYEAITLTFGMADDDAADLRFAWTSGDVLAQTAATDVPIRIVATASRDGDSCTLDIALESDDTIEVAVEDGGQIEIVPGEEVEIPVEIDPDLIFGTVDLPASCTGGATVAIDADNNPEVANDILDNILNNGALRLVASEGHDHGHEH